MKKKIFALGLCLVLIVACLPAAAAVRTAKDRTDKEYAADLIDYGVWDVVLVNSSPGSGASGFGVRQKPGDTPIAFEKFVQALVEGVNTQPGCELAITFRFTSTIASSVWSGYSVSMGTEQINDVGQNNINGFPFDFYIPIDEGKARGGVAGPRDDRGNLNPIPPDGAANVFSKTIPDQDWVGPDMADLYKQYPANLLDKIGFTVYTAKVPASNDVNPFRWPAGTPDEDDPYGRLDYDKTKVAGAKVFQKVALAGKPYAPDGAIAAKVTAGTVNLAMSGWMTDKDFVVTNQYQVVDEYMQTANNAYGSTQVLYIHYTFYWDGGYSSPTNPASPVSPRAAADLRAVAGGSAVHDNYYMASRAAFKWVLVVKPERIPPVNPSNPSPRPSVMPSEPPEEEITDRPDPIEMPTDDGDNTGGGGTDTVPTSKPPTGMPFTGGFSLGNLFFVGLFLLGTGLIFLVSRKKREEEDSPNP